MFQLVSGDTGTLHAKNMDDLEIIDHHDNAAIRTKREDDSQQRRIVADGRIYTTLSDDEDENLMQPTTTRMRSSGYVGYSLTIDRKGAMKMSRSDSEIFDGACSTSSRICYLCEAETRQMKVAQTLTGILKEGQQKSGNKANSDQVDAAEKRVVESIKECCPERMDSATDTTMSKKPAQRFWKLHENANKKDEQYDKKRNTDSTETLWSKAEVLGPEETESNQSRTKHDYRPSSIKSKESLDYILDNNQIHTNPSLKRVQVKSREDWRRTAGADAVSSPMESERRGRDLITCTSADFAADMMPTVDM